jgi:hypothetical protein
LRGGHNNMITVPSGRNRGQVDRGPTTKRPTSTYVPTHRETPQAIAFRWNGREIEIFVDETYVGCLPVVA